MPDGFGEMAFAISPSFFHSLTGRTAELSSRPFARVRNVFRKRKTPRPAGKPGGYDYSLPTANLVCLLHIK